MHGSARPSVRATPLRSRPLTYVVYKVCVSHHSLRDRAAAVRPHVTTSSYARNDATEEVCVRPSSGRYDHVGGSTCIYGYNRWHCGRHDGVNSCVLRAPGRCTSAVACCAPW